MGPMVEWSKALGSELDALGVHLVSGEDGVAAGACDGRLQLRGWRQSGLAFHDKLSLP